MGGRGASSSVGKKKSGTNTGGSPTGNGSDFDKAKAHFGSAYGIVLDDSLKGVDPAVLEDTLRAAEEMFSEFPSVVPEISLIRNDTSSGAYAYATWNAMQQSKIAIGSLMQDKGQADASIKSDGTYHPPNTSVQSIISHEVGHVMETAIVKKRYPGDPYRVYDERRKRKVATEIVGQAAKRVKKTPAGKTPSGRQKKIGDMIAEVSGYATTNRSEALAEMVSDVFANGANAHPLSKEVWGILKKELG